MSGLRSPYPTSRGTTGQGGTEWDPEKSAEKGHGADVYTSELSSGVGRQNHLIFHPSAMDGMQRTLKQRHVQMIAIAGTLGTGLFLGSGKALSRSGPLGALIAYLLIGSVAYSSLCAIGEQTSLAPISGTFPHYAARWVDPALGFAVGWNYFYTQAITVPVEVTAAQILLTYWDERTWVVPLYTAVIIIGMITINFFGTRYFGESEFFFCCIKLSLITGLIIAGLVVDLGGGPNRERLGFRYWKNPGALTTYLEEGSLGRFLAIVGSLIQAAFSYQGMETVAIAAAETRSPRRNVSRAVRKVFWRILIFYIAGIIVTGMLVAYDDPDLLQSTGTAAQSPYVIAFTRAGIKVLPSIINAAVFTSAFSAGNSFLYASSRILYGLALRGQAPKIFSRTTKSGLPAYAVAMVSCFSVLAFMNVKSGSATVFNWLANLTTIGGFFTWAAINLTYLRFYAGMKAQGYDRRQLHYWSGLQPYLSIWGLFWCTLIIIINGFAVFWDFNASDFIIAYINIPLFAILYFGYKFLKRSKIHKASEMDFVTGIPTVEETEEELVPPRTLGGKIFQAVF